MTDYPNDFPPNFNYVKVDKGFRANLYSESDISLWIKLYSEKTMTNWRVKFRKSNPSRYVCRKVFVCHHSGMRRVDPAQNKRGKSKNFNCKAEIDILVKLTTQNTKKKDIFIKDGYPAIIIINHAHNHEVETAEVLSFLKPADETRTIFEGYFNDGFGIKEAMNFHKSKMELDFLESGKEIANALMNPAYRTVQNWYAKWTKDNLEPQSGFNNTNCQVIVKDVDSENNSGSAHSSCFNSNIKEEDNTKDFSKEEDLEYLYENIKETFMDKLSNFKASPSTLKLFLHCLQKVKTDVGWNTFLWAAVSQIPRRYHRHANIHVQTTSIRRCPGVTRSRKWLPIGHSFKGEKNIKKRRNLALKVKLNVANTKSHVSGH